MNLLQSLSPDGRQLAKAEKLAKKIEALSGEYKALSDAELQAKTSQFRQRLSQGESLDLSLIHIYYYFRTTPSGFLSNGSFCGNDTDSLMRMMRKYIVDIVCRWIEVYADVYKRQFHDLDLMIDEHACEQVARLFSPLGIRHPQLPSPQFHTQCFMEFTISGVEIDVIGNLRIEHEGQIVSFPLQSEEIEGQIMLGGQRIPLHSCLLYTSRCV